nr:MAG TPA: hypothetical protein [Caudoviricetes sp.]
MSEYLRFHERVQTYLRVRKPKNLLERLLIRQLFRHNIFQFLRLPTRLFL